MRARQPSKSLKLLRGRFSSTYIDFQNSRSTASVCTVSWFTTSPPAFPDLVSLASTMAAAALRDCDTRRCAVTMIRNSDKLCRPIARDSQDTLRPCRTCSTHACSYISTASRFAASIRKSGPGFGRAPPAGAPGNFPTLDNVSQLMWVITFTDAVEEAVMVP
jgi:hypothetical protein